MSRKLLAAVMLACLPRPGPAAPFDVLAVDASPRAAALGGAQVAAAEDGYAAAYNPAALGAARRNEASFSYAAHFAGTRSDAAGLALTSGWGASLRRFDSGPVARTTLDNPDGTGLGTARLTSSAAGIAYGAAVAPSLRLGLGLQWLNQNADGRVASNAAVDLGAAWRSGESAGLSLGAAVRRLGPAARSRDGREELPRTLALGGAYRAAWGSARGLGTVELAHDAYFGRRLAVGLELGATSGAAARLGWRSDADAAAGLSLGVGWRGERLGFDYALRPLGALGSAHLLSASLLWGPAAVSGR